MGQVGVLKQIETSFYSQIEEMTNWLNKELVPIKEGIDSAITFIAQGIIGLERKEGAILTTGIGVVDSGIDLVRRLQVENQLRGLCWTLVRVGAVWLGIFAVQNPLAKIIGAMAFSGHAIYKGLVAAEAAE